MAPPQTEPVSQLLSTTSVPESTLHLPRIICLHGGGTNARIFYAQCRVLRLQLAAHFRLVFVDAPFMSGVPGPDVASVYADWGPFRSWIRIDAARETLVGEAAAQKLPEYTAVEQAIQSAMREDDKLGATGPWAGLLGFSQGAKLAGALLLRQQRRTATVSGVNDQSESQGLPNYRFAVLMAGRGPPLFLDTPKASGFPILHYPTIHVHGTRDQGITFHRELLQLYCVNESATLVEWDGNHRVPIKTKDVAAVVAAILKVAREVGIEWR